MIKKANRVVSMSRGGINIIKRSLNLGKLANKKITTVSSEEALKDIIPINWNDEVLNDTKKVVVCGINK